MIGKTQPRLPRQRGFTLIELMVVVTIVALLLTVGIPMMSNSIDRNSVISKVNELLGALQIARSEAVTRNSKVTLCFMKRADPPLDPPLCDAAGSLQTGWLVFTDPDGDAFIDAGEEILASSSGTAEKFTFETGGLTSITYGALGTANVPVNTGGTLIVCRGNEYSSQVSIDATGRATASKRTVCYL